MRSENQKIDWTNPYDPKTIKELQKWQYALDEKEWHAVISMSEGLKAYQQELQEKQEFRLKIQSEAEKTMAIFWEKFREIENQKNISGDESLQKLRELQKDVKSSLSEMLEENKRLKEEFNRLDTAYQNVQSGWTERQQEVCDSINHIIEVNNIQVRNLQGDGFIPIEMLQSRIAESRLDNLPAIQEQPDVMQVIRNLVAPDDNDSMIENTVNDKVDVFLQMARAQNVFADIRLARGLVGGSESIKDISRMHANLEPLRAKIVSEKVYEKNILADAEAMMTIHDFGLCKQKLEGSKLAINKAKEVSEKINEKVLEIKSKNPDVETPRHRL